MSDSLKHFNAQLVKCKLCPRLVAYRETVDLPASLKLQPCWRKPVPGFGDSHAWLAILGLAPSSQGGNRTGRIFTGDKSAIFLMRALHQVGLANQEQSTSIYDGLCLKGCYMTAAVKCVPPKHTPTREEFKRCVTSYLLQELELLSNLKAVLVLGRLAFDAYFEWAKQLNPHLTKPSFVHGREYRFPHLPILYASYHPSPRNTNTGLLTQDMLIHLMMKIIELNK
ncbi:hypothetical protein PHSC3_001461 [Chlamydiales bacterium STE3]|nr:hypothetical protein PHSC3_001461 [Chlamydiales bacterium STE3]